jgi:uncharacterized membrane protein
MVSVETILSWVLRIGLMLGATLMTVGFFSETSLIWAGIVVLALTPLLRVVIAGLTFLSKGEWFFFVIALYVISVLVIGIFL